MVLNLIGFLVSSKRKRMKSGKTAVASCCPQLPVTSSLSKVIQTVAEKRIGSMKAFRKILETFRVT